MIHSVASESSLCNDLGEASQRLDREIEGDVIRRLRTLAGLLAQSLTHPTPLLTRMLSHRPRLQRGDEPGLAVLRELGLDREPRRAGFDLVDIHSGLESRVRFLDTSQGWRGS